MTVNCYVSSAENAYPVADGIPVGRISFMRSCRLVPLSSAFSLYALQWFSSSLVAASRYQWGLLTTKICPSSVTILTLVILPDRKPSHVWPCLSMNIMYKFPRCFRIADIKESLSTSDPAPTMVTVREEMTLSESRNSVTRKWSRNMLGMGSSAGTDVRQFPLW